MTTQYRQGDVLLIHVDAIPDNLDPEKGPVILAHGEVTGHAHRIRSRSAKLFSGTAGRFLRLTAPATLEHEEHNPVVLPAGIYRVVRQVEYTPAEIRTVAD